LNRRQITIAVKLVGAIILFSLPVLMVLFDVVASLLSNHEQINYFVSKAFFLKIYNSIRLSLAVSLLAMSSSLLLNHLFFKLQNIRLREMLLLSLLLLFAVSPVIYLVTLTRIELFQHLPAFWQSVLVLTLNCAPFSFAVVMFAVCAIDKESLTTAFLHASPLMVVRHIILPQLYVPLTLGGGIIFILTFTQQEVPSFLGYRTFAEDFLSRLLVMTDIREEVVYALPFLLLAVVAVITLIVICRQKHFFGLLDRERFEFTTFPSLFARRQLADVPVAMLIIAIPLILLGSLLNHTVLREMVTLASDNFNPIRITLITASIVAIVGTVLGNFIYMVLNRIPGRFPKIVCGSLLLGHWLLPSSLVGLGLLEIKQFFALYWAGSDLLFFFMGYLVRLIPVAVFLATLLNIIFRTHIDTVVTFMPVNKLDVFMKLRMPVQWPCWLLTWSILAVFALSELSMTILLVPPGVETVIIRIYNLMHYGDYSTVAFLSFVQVVLVAGTIFIASCSLRKR